jgi:hypothetical protein
MISRFTTASWSGVDKEDLNLAAMSLHDIECLEMTEWERNFWDSLVKTVDSAYDRPIESYTTFVLLYNAPSQWTHDEFQSFIDPNNSVAQILLAHFIAIQAVLTPILVLERVGFQGIDAPTATLGWVEGIYRNVPDRLRHYVTWPRQISRYPFMNFKGQRQLDFYD